MKLMKNTWYQWNDPDEGICSKSVRYLGFGTEPGTAIVEDAMGIEFLVFEHELAELIDEKSEAKTVLDDLIFAPFLQFKSVCNLRISKTGRVLAVVNVPHHYHYQISVPTEVGFDLANAYSISLVEPTRIGDEEPRPATTTIVVGFAGGSVTFSAQTPEKTRVLYEILNKLRLYFMGFLEAPIEDEADFNLDQELTPQSWAVPSDVMPVLVKHHRNGVIVALRHESKELVDDYAGLLRDENFGYTHTVEVRHNAEAGYYFIAIVITMYPIIAQSSIRVIDFGRDDTYNHAQARLSKTAVEN